MAGYRLLDDNTERRVERARRLLAESDAHRGSADLQQFVEQMDLAVQLHAAFLDDGGGLRQGMSARDKEQGLTLLVHLALRSLPMPSMVSVMQLECSTAAFDAAEELLGRGERSLDLLGKLSQGFLLMLLAVHASKHEGVMKVLADTAEMALFWERAWASAAAGLEQRQRRAGFSPALTAAEARRACLLLQMRCGACLTETAELKPGELDGEVASPQLYLPEAMWAIKQMRQLGPENAAFLSYRAGVLLSHTSPAAAAAEFRAATEQAAATKAHYMAAIAGTRLAWLLMLGAAGPHWSLAEVRAVLAAAAAAFSLCKRWILKVSAKEHGESLKELEQLVEETAAAAPGQDALPALPVRPWEIGESVLDASRCAACSKMSLHLQKCSRCRQVQYCSRACQVKHWKEGGHKQECARLAAARGGGGGGS